MGAQRCPVCGGSGEYTPANDRYATNVPFPQTCHGCGGKGWVAVPSEPIRPFYRPGIFDIRPPKTSFP